MSLYCCISSQNSIFSTLQEMEHDNGEVTVCLTRNVQVSDHNEKSTKEYSKYKKNHIACMCMETTPVVKSHKLKKIVYPILILQQEIKAVKEILSFWTQLALRAIAARGGCRVRDTTKSTQEAR